MYRPGFREEEPGTLKSYAPYCQLGHLLPVAPAATGFYDGLHPATTVRYLQCQAHRGGPTKAETPTFTRMKKWLAFIVLLITLAGSFYPCCLADNCSDDPVSTQHQDEDRETGTCSPFFACGSCVGFVQLAKPILVPQPPPQRSTPHERVEPFTLSGFSSSFWQPPRSC